MQLHDAYPSKYLKATDLGGEAVRARIKNVAWETVGKDRKPVMTFAGRGLKPLPLNKTNFQTCADGLGADSDDWIGMEIEVFSMPVPDPQGRVVDGLRVRVPPIRGASVNVAPNARAHQETAPDPSPPPSVYEDLDDLIPDGDPFAPEIRG